MATNGVGSAGSMGLVLVSFTVYHLVARTLRAEVNPFAFLAVTYGVSLAVTLAGWWWTAGSGALVGRDGAGAVVLGCSLVGIELGFVAAYRSGWGLAVAPTFANVALALVLAPLGAWLLRERPSPAQLGGMALCLAGLWLLARR